ncbi:MAG: hypothetical protein V3U23_04090, partial [Kiloniellales bacterium]
MEQVLTCAGEQWVRKPAAALEEGGETAHQAKALLILAAKQTPERAAVGVRRPAQNGPLQRR